MQLMSAALAVTGSRHGLIFEPLQNRCRLLRFSRFDLAPAFGFRAALRVGDREVVFPLCPLDGASPFSLVDQCSGPATWGLRGIDSASGLKVALDVYLPFRPRDADFSTAPVLPLELHV